MGWSSNTTTTPFHSKQEQWERSTMHQNITIPTGAPTRQNGNVGKMQTRKNSQLHHVLQLNQHQP